MKQKATFLFVLFVLTTCFAVAQEKKLPTLDSAKKEIQKTDPKKTEILELDPAKVETQFLNSLDYPELQVVPKASERLQLDGRMEADNGYVSIFWPFHLASGTTMLIALLHKNKFKPNSENDETYRKNADFKVNAAAGISAAWFGLTYFVSASQPYSSALKTINQSKGNDKKTLLLRERLAEEAMQKPAELMKMLTYLSTITNFIAVAGMSDMVNDDYNLYVGLGLLTSFIPMIFKNRYIENYEKHLEYKRKIYAPVVFTDIYKANQYANWSPRLVLQWNF